MRPTIAALVAVPLLLAGAVACGGDGGTAASDDPSSDQDQGVELAECLRDQGIDVEDPDADDPQGFMEGLSDAERERVQEALDACEEYMPRPEDDPMDDPEAQEAFLDYTGCMREHGIDLPDPDFDSSGYQIDRELVEDPDFQDAQEACEPILRDQFGEPSAEGNVRGDAPEMQGGSDG